MNSAARPLSLAMEAFTVRPKICQPSRKRKKENQGFRQLSEFSASLNKPWNPQVSGKSHTYTNQVSEYTKLHPNQETVMGQYSSH